MIKALPKPREAQQLCKLRALRVQRAREAVAQAQAAAQRAAQAVRERQQSVERVRTSLEDLQQAVVTTFASAMPRWSRVATAQKDRLDDRLHDEEHELIQEEQALERAEEEVQQARAELTRALAREDVVRDLAKQARSAQLNAREQRAERDLEDLGRPAQHSGGRTG
jgi:hypothetical protein